MEIPKLQAEKIIMPKSSINTQFRTTYIYSVLILGSIYLQYIYMYMTLITHRSWVVRQARLTTPHLWGASPTTTSVPTLETPPPRAGTTIPHSTWINHCSHYNSLPTVFEVGAPKYVALLFIMPTLMHTTWASVYSAPDWSSSLWRTPTMPPAVHQT